MTLHSRFAEEIDTILDALEAGGELPAGIDRRGVTFAHLVREEGRWLILAAAWENEREGAPLPADLI